MAHKLIIVVLLCTSMVGKCQQEIVDVLETDENTFNGSDDYLSGEFVLDLNRANTEQFTSCGLFSPKEVSALFAHRARFGTFLSVYELVQYLENPERLLEIKDFIRCDRNVLKPKPKNQFLTRLTAKDIQEGQVDLAVRSRLKVDVDNQLSFRFLADRDAGELWFTENEYPDHVSGSVTHISKQGTKYIAGDYRVNMGCGLVLGSMFGVGKSYSIYSLYRPPVALQALATGNEFDYHRGLAFHRLKGKSAITAFLSARNCDVTGATDSTFRGFDLSGVHVRPTEQTKIPTTGARLIGIGWTHHVRKTEIGVHGYGVQFDKTFEPRPDIYNAATLGNKKAGKLGVFVKRSLNGGFAFGELAIDHHHNHAFVGGILTSLGPRWNFGAVHRSVASGYYNFHNRFFSEFSSGDNEVGLFAQLTGKLNHNWEISLSNDIFTRPWFERNQSPFDVYSEQQFEVVYQPSKRNRFSIRWSTNRPASSSNIGEHQPNDRVKKCRLHIRSELTKNLRYQFRYNTAYYRLKQGMNHSSLLYHDIRWSPSKKLRLSARILFANIPDYDLRLYAYENDVLYQFSVPGSFEDQVRSYVLLLYKPIKALRFELKLSTNTTVKREDKSVFINRMLNRSSDIRVQIVWTWE